MIGDPSGRLTAKSLLAADRLQSNKEAIARQIERISGRFCFQGSFRVIDNSQWHSKLSFMDFLTSVGPHMRVSTMLQREWYYF